MTKEIPTGGWRRKIAAEMAKLNAAAARTENEEQLEAIEARLRALLAEVVARK